MARSDRSTVIESDSVSDLGALQRELEEIASEARHLQEQQQTLVKRKAAVEKQMAKVLKDLGVLDRISPRGEGTAVRERGAGAGKSSGKGPRGQKSGKRYSAEERRAAVEFVHGRMEEGTTITAAIEEFNKKHKPRGKGAMNYQSLLRWRVE